MKDKGSEAYLQSNTPSSISFSKVLRYTDSISSYNITTRTTAAPVRCIKAIYTPIDSGIQEAGIDNPLVNIVEPLFIYDVTGRVVKEILGNGVYIEYLYDNNGNLIQQNLVQ